MVAGIELAPRANAIGAKTRATRCSTHKCFEAGALIRVTGDIIALSPPLIVSESQIGEMFDKLATIIKQVA